MLLVLAVALAPASIGFAVAAPAAPSQASAAAVMPDCSQHQHGAPSGQTQKGVNHATCPAGCTLCFVIVTSDAPSVTYSVPVSATLKPQHPGAALASLMGSPPFRPPRA